MFTLNKINTKRLNWQVESEMESPLNPFIQVEAMW